MLWAIPIRITEQSGNNLQDYAVRIQLDSSFPLWWLLRSDNFFFMDTGGEKLYHYVEKLDDTNKQATIWVRIPSLGANSSKQILMVLGTTGFRYMNDPSNVFLFFDDFDSDTLDTSKWVLGYNGYGAVSYSLSDSVITLYSPDATWRSMHSTYVVSVSDRVAVEAKVKILSTDQAPHVLFLVSDDDSNTQRFGIREDGTDTAGNNMEIQYRVSGTYYYIPLSANVGNDWFIAQILKTGDYTFTGRVLDLNYNIIGNEATTTQSSWTIDWWINIWVKDSSGFQWDWVRVRPYAEPEPSVSLGEPFKPRVQKIDRIVEDFYTRGVLGVEAV